MLRSKKFKSVAIGDLYTLGVTHSNELFGWGEGYLQGSNSNEPVLISSELKAKYVSAGWKHSAIIDVDGQVHTWGNGGSWFDGGGQLGENVTYTIHYQSTNTPSNICFIFFMNRSWKCNVRVSSKVSTH